MIALVDTWGSLTPNLEPAEARASLRALRRTARLLTGPRAAGLCRRFAAAETNPVALEPASGVINAMAAAKSGPPMPVSSDPQRERSSDVRDYRSVSP